MSEEKKYKIVVVEDEALIAAEIVSTLDLLGYQVVGQAMNGDKALDLFANNAFDLALLDINIKGQRNGIDLGKILNKKYGIPFIYLTSYSDKNTLSEVKETAPAAYILKPFTTNDLKVNIELAFYNHEKGLEKKELRKAYIEEQIGCALAEREYEVLMAFNEGLSYKQVAESLFISINTVKHYQKNIFRLFGVTSKSELLVALQTMQ